MSLVLYLKKASPYPRSSRLSSRILIILCFTFRAMIYLELIFMKDVRSVSRFTFLHVTPSCSNTICWRDYLCPIVLPLLFRWTLVDYIYGGLFWAVCSFPLIYLSVLSPVPHCLDYCSLDVVLKSGNFCPPSLFFYFNSILAILDLLLLHINFRISLSMFIK